MALFLNLSMFWQGDPYLWRRYLVLGTRETHSTVPDQVMISYEEESRLIAIGIYNELKSKGFQVTMHYDKQEEKLQEIMTRGVERTSIMVVALTRKYKQTPHSYAGIRLSGSYSKHSQPCQTSTMKFFLKIVHDFESLTVFAKSSIFNVWQGSGYVSG